MPEQKDWIDRNFATRRMSGPEGLTTYIGAFLIGTSLIAAGSAATIQYVCDTQAAEASERPGPEDPSCDSHTETALHTMKVSGIAGVAAVAAAVESSYNRRRRLEDQ